MKKINKHLLIRMPRISPEIILKIFLYNTKKRSDRYRISVTRKPDSAGIDWHAKT